MERILIESAFRAVLLALATGAVLSLMRVKSASGRHAAWTLTLVAMLALPLWTLWGPKASLPVLPSRANISTVAAPVARAFVTARTPESLPVTPINTAPPANNTSHPSGVPWSAVAPGIYALGALILLGRLLVGTLRAQRLIRTAQIRQGHWTSRSCSAPVTVGWIHPVVILPDDWETWSSTQLDAVLLHEQEHARRRDPLIQWLALLNRAVFWFHPMAWWLERRLAALAEDACDAAVLSRGHIPAEYCEYLLSMARAVTGAGARVDIVGAAMPGAFLSQRIGRILKAVPESPVTRRRLVWALVVCAGLSAAVTAATLVPAKARAGVAMPQSGSGQKLPEFWFDDDEWHLETAPLMSAQEMEQYRRLLTVAERDAFIADFWQRRDRTDGTAENEVRREFERRIKYASENYADPESAATFGYQTDRGRWYVMFGQPDAVRVFGSSNVDEYGVSRRAEEWDYRSLDDLGRNVTVRFDVGSYFGCTWRGGKYRIVSPAPIARFNGVTSASGRKPFAQTYAGHFVYISFPIDERAVAMKWGMRSDRDGHIVLDEQTGAIDYIQGQFLDPFDDPNRSRNVPVKNMLSHFTGLQLFEPDGIACTEQLPPDTYTLRVESRLMDRTIRTDSVTFTVK